MATGQKHTLHFCSALSPLKPQVPELRNYQVYKINNYSHPLFWRHESRYCYGLNVCFSHMKNSYVETLTPNVMVFGSGAFRR